MNGGFGKAACLSSLLNVVYFFSKQVSDSALAEQGDFSYTSFHKVTPYHPE